MGHRGSHPSQKREGSEAPKPKVAPEVVQIMTSAAQPEVRHSTPPPEFVRDISAGDNVRVGHSEVQSRVESVVFKAESPVRAEDGIRVDNCIRAERFERGVRVENGVQLPGDEIRLQGGER